MRIKEVLTLPTNELALLLEGLVSDCYDLKLGVDSAVDPDRKKIATISKKIVKITVELRHRGWEAIDCEGNVVYNLISNSKKAGETDMIERLCPYCEYTIMERIVNEDDTVTYVCPECKWSGSIYELKNVEERG